MRKEKAQIIFEDGTTFSGNVFAEGKTCDAEVVFNTSMLGYQEVLTDPSYKNQMVVLTCPMVGNYGINKSDNESSQIQVSALLVREYCPNYCNWEANESLKSFLEQQNVIGIECLDTRKLTNYLRKNGASHARIQVEGQAQSDTVTNTITTKQSIPLVTSNEAKAYHIGLIDMGVKQSIIDRLERVNCRVSILTPTVSADEILNAAYDGIMVSNGPGNPEDYTATVTTVQKILGNIPLFGICLGQQILGLALGAKINKLKFGHHGSNHPILNLENKKVEISAQNHNYVICNDSIANTAIECTHINLLDNSIAGIKAADHWAFAVQYHPEAGPGPEDSLYLFKDFLQMINNFKAQ